MTICIFIKERVFKKSILYRSTSSGGGVAETGGARAGKLWKIQNKKDTEFSMEFTSLGFTILKSQAGIKVFPTLHFEMDSGWISSQSLDRY